MLDGDTQSDLSPGDVLETSDHYGQCLTTTIASAGCNRPVSINSSAVGNEVSPSSKHEDAAFYIEYGNTSRLEAGELAHWRQGDFDRTEAVRGARQFR